MAAGGRLQGQFLHVTKNGKAGRRLWEPEWDDPVFLEKYGHFLAAAARKWNGNPSVAFTDVYPHWFAPNCGRKFAGKDYDLPFDQHWLIATIAPRLMAVGSAEDDPWTCPSGEHAGLDLARPAWGKYADRCHYFIRPGGHDICSIDWADYMAFAKRKGW